MLSSSPGDAVVHEGHPVDEAIAAATKGGTDSGHGTELRVYTWSKAERRHTATALGAA